MGSGLGSLLTWTWIRPNNTKDGLFGTFWVTMTCGKPCQGKTVIFGGDSCMFGGLKRGHGVTAGNIFPLGRGLGPMMERMDCLANFGQNKLILTSSNMGVFLSFWGSDGGPKGSWARNFFLLDHRLGPTM